MSLFVFAAVAIAVVGILLHQNRAQAHSRWLREFEAQQKPSEDLKTFAKMVDARLVELEKANRNAQLRSLSR